ncbi:unnamed protein product [Phaeothamnion confervicola]
MLGSQVRANKSVKSTQLQASLKAAGFEANRRHVNNAKLRVKKEMALGEDDSYQLIKPFLKAFEVSCLSLFCLFALETPPTLFLFSRVEFFKHRCDFCIVTTVEVVFYRIYPSLQSQTRFSFRNFEYLNLYLRSHLNCAFFCGLCRG